MSKENDFIELVLEIASDRNSRAVTKDIEAAERDDEPFINDSDDSPANLDSLFQDFKIIEPPLGDVEELWDPRLEGLFNRYATSREEFDTFFSSLGLVYFQPHELLVMGGSNASGPCKGKNGIPPKSLWPNMVPTILALDEIRGILGYSVRTTSVYRSPEYNECLRVTLGNSGVAKFSQHLSFRAIDFAGYQGVPSGWGDAVEKVRKKWGLWTKTYKSFVHIDSRYFGKTS
ncbi:MAG: D-Ala-D-Ala carboxypeptidase family metallohydrolase [Paracoccus sp. (in: a-proteobacteria)]|uniref:D-Ala-D-Ala carboxypeptidase family metallohydrolase n=1 Tax=Paracoccus sp. TaxID=267 RepID=UPI00405973B1